VNEFTIIRLVLTALPALLVVLFLLDLLIEEYLRLMELAGLARRRTSADRHADAPSHPDDSDGTTTPLRPAR
jgi:hypothetical protein